MSDATLIWTSVQSNMKEDRHIADCRYRPNTAVIYVSTNALLHSCTAQANNAKRHCRTNASIPLEWRYITMGRHMYPSNLPIPVKDLNPI